MAERGPQGLYIAECFLPGVDAAAVRELDARASGTAAELTSGGEPVSYHGSLLMREDEVLLCLFEGSEQAVRKAAGQAGVPFERIQPADSSPRPITDTT